MHWIHESITGHALRQPDAEAILQEGRHALSYAGLVAEIDRVTALLRERGIGPCDRVAVVLPEGPELAVSIIATLCRATCAPLNPAYSAVEFARWFETMRIDALITAPGMASPALSVAARLGIRTIEVEVDASAPAGVMSVRKGLDTPVQPALDGTPSEGDIALLLFTSATSAAPKLTPLSHANLAASTRNIRDVLKLSFADRCLGVMPLFHIHGISTLFASAISGGAYASVDRLTPERFFSAMSRFGGTWYSASPAIHLALVDAAPQFIRPGQSTLRFARSASSAMPAKLLTQIERTFGVPLIEAYGMTEASPLIASNGLEPARRKAGSVGRPAGTEVAILDAAGHPSPSAVKGEIAVRGPNVFAGYEGNEAVNTLAFAGDWFRTGDLGYLDSDGFLFVTGRQKEVINRGGEKVSPRMIEEALLQHPAVAQAVVFPLPDRALGEAIAAAVVLHEVAQSLLGDSSDDVLGAASIARRIRDFSAQRLAAFEVPAQILIVDQIPVGQTGKLNRADLPGVLKLLDGDGRPNLRARVSPTPPRNPAEIFIAQTVADVLRIAAPGIHDDFFELGGNSLLAMSVIARLNQAFDLSLANDALFVHSTVARLADEVGAALANRAVNRSATGGEPASEWSAARRAIPRRPAGEPPPLSFAQDRTFFAHQLEAGSAYNVSASLRLRGPVKVEAIEAALEQVAARHETLRASFQLADGTPIQLIADPRPIDLPRVDLNSLPPAQRWTALTRVSAREAATGFDLSAGSLLRAMLVRIDDQQHVLLLTLHHIVSDGWSVGVLQRELAAFYQANVVGEPVKLLPLPIQYGDFAAWQRRMLSEGRIDPQIDYWKSKLAGLPPLCTFPADRPRPAVQSFQGQVVHSAIDQPLVDRLSAVGKAQGATPFVVFLAAFQTLLHRHNHQEDATVGVPIANRTRPELEPLIGFVANTLVLRARMADDPAFVDFLVRVKDEALDALANQQVPLERLIDELRVERNPDRSPLFQVMFAFQNLPGTSSDAFSDDDPRRPLNFGHDLSAVPFEAPKHGAKFDLTLYLSASSEGLSAIWLFNTDLFERASIERLALRFDVLLRSIASQPQTRLSELQILPLSEAEQIRAWSDAPSFQARRRFLDLFAEQVERSPASIAILAGGTSLSYRQLSDAADTLRERLDQLELPAGCLVGLCLERNEWFPIAALAVWKSGRALLPLNPDYPAERLSFMIADARPAILLSQTSVAARLAAMAGSDGPPIVTLDDGASTDARPRRDGAATPGLAYVIYTSGTSGRPKGVAITFGNIDHYIPALNDSIGIRPGDRYLHTASFSFSSSIRQLAVPLASGAVLVMASADQLRDPIALFERIRSEKVSVIDLVPSYLRACLDAIATLSAEARSRLGEYAVRQVLSASEPLPTELVARWRTLFGPGARFMNMYGQTETTGIVATHAIGDSQAGDDAIVPVGRPLMGTTIHVIDRAGRPAPIGVCGEIHIGGPTVGEGYLNQPALNAAQFVTPADERFYRTGDLGRFRQDGTIQIAGRIDSQFKVRGFRIEPAEIESAIQSHPHVAECAVAAHEADGVARLVAMVAYRDGRNDSAAAQQIRDHLRTRLPEYMIPQQVQWVDHLPRTANGKLDRSAIASLLKKEPMKKEPAELASASAQDSVRRPRTPPRTELEIRLAEVWQKTLGIDRVYVDENFFDLGGNSLTCISVVVHAKERGLDLNLWQIYRHQTIAELADVLERSMNGSVPATETAADLVDKSASRPIPARPAEQDYLVTERSLREYGREALTRTGLNTAAAEIVTDVQLEASLRGQLTHHMISIPRYARRLSSGKLNPRATLRIEHETDNSARMDGDNGPGQWIATVAMDVAIAKARQSGIGMVAVRRSNHFGAAAQYVWNCTRAGFIGLCTTNGPGILAPTGGVTPLFGNNPLGVGIPANRRHPILVDIAMSVATRGKIGLFVAEGKPLKPGWILDKLGRASIDLADLAAGLGVPIGGHKGYGLALVMEILSGVLSGAGFGINHLRDVLQKSRKPADYGHFFMAIDPQRFIPADDFRSRVDDLIDQIKSSRRAEGTQEIFVPGEMELRARQRSLREGVTLRPATYHSLVTYARDVGLQTVLELTDTQSILPSAVAAP